MKKALIASILLICMLGLCSCSRETPQTSQSVPSGWSASANELEIKAEAEKIQQACPHVANPNCFSLASDGRLLLADLNQGISIMDSNGVQQIPCVDTSMRLPAAVCEYQGEYYVADYRNNRVAVLNRQGHMVREWTHETMSDPEGITVDEKGNIYVASYGNGYVLKFSSAGKLLNSWHSASSSSDVLVHPHGMTYSRGKIYITELNPPGRVIVFDTEGNFLGQFGNNDSVELEYPTSLFIAGDTVYVADAVACQIKMFSTEGAYLGAFGSFGMDAGEFYYPYGVGVDGGGNIFVGDTHNRRVQVFDSNGKLIKIYAEQAIQIGSPAARRGVDGLRLNVTESMDFEIDSIAVHNGWLYGINRSKGTLANHLNGANVLNRSGYNYPWRIRYASAGLLLVDEPGELVYIPDEMGSSIYYPLTSLQFNVPELSSAFIYRFQEAVIGNKSIFLANTLPGNILQLNAYGGFEAKIELPADGSLGIPRVTGLATEGEKLFYADMKGRVGCVNLDTHEHFSFTSPVGLYQPYTVATGQGIVAISEPYVNRVQFWNAETLEWVGYIDDKATAEVDRPMDVAFDGESLLVASTGNGKVLRFDTAPLRAQAPNAEYGASQAPCIFNVSSEEIDASDSLFMKIYHHRVSKAISFWQNYRDENGIVQYDFSFSFLSDNLPVPAGYGREIWANGVAQYTLLNHYANTERSLAEEKLHADWLARNAVRNAQGIYYWANDYKTTNPNLQPGFMAASTQALGAAALVKAAEHFPENAEQYLKIAKGALTAFDVPVKGGGVRADFNGYVFYADYANPSGYISYDVIPMAWTTAALRETGDLGERYYLEVCDTWTGALPVRTMFGDSLFCAADFTDNSVIHVWSSNLANTVISFLQERG